MLIKCPECELQVSDKAVFCPHCGFVLKENRPIIRKKSNKRRLPNGFGQIAEIKNRNLRKPFRAMVSVGKRDDGRPIVRPLKPESYFETYNDAYAALVEYNRNPYDLEPSIIVSELYKKWSSEYFKTLKSESGIRTITSSWAYCSAVYNMRVKDLRARHIKACINNGTAIVNGEVRETTPNIKSRIKSTFNTMLDYAVEYEIVDKNYARTFSLSDEIIDERERLKNPHITFTDEEIFKLWKNIYTIPYVDVILIQCYTGLRPQEIGLIKLENINLPDRYITAGIKTKAGIDRLIPIHSKIFELIKNRYYQSSKEMGKYLITCTDSKNKQNQMFSYNKYQYRFSKIIKDLGLNPEHRPHDCRVWFITQAKKYGVDEYAIKYIVGHEINDITESVYTKRDPKWLKSEIEKIK